MKQSVGAIALTFIWTAGLAGFAQASPPANITGPTEVGISKMPPGHYEMIEQDSGKRYQLTVTTRGSMILSPAKAQPAVTNVAGVAVAPAVVPQAATVPPAVSKSSVQRLMEKGMQQGVQQLMKKGGTRQLQNLIK